MSQDTALPVTNVLGVGISAVTMTQAVEQITCWVEDCSQSYVVVCPVFTIMACWRDPSLRSVVNQAGLVTPDGMPLVFLSRKMGYPQTERVYGPDLMLAVSEMAVRRGYKQFYYGGAEGVAEQLAKNLTALYPGLQVAGTHSPPFRSLSAQEQADVIDKINSANPDIVWVGLGSPKQDWWMADYRNRLSAPVLIGVGAAFDFHAGLKAQAPRWMQRNGLEWLFRLVTEPRRLWKRYLINNPLFMLLILAQLLKIRRYEL